MKRKSILVLLAVAVLPICVAGAETIRLDQLDVHPLRQDWGKPLVDRSVGNQPLRIAGQAIEHGIGTHASSVWWIDLGGRATRFTAQVGMDDEVKGETSTGVNVRIYGDGKVLFKSGPIRPGEAAKPLDLDLTGIGTLILTVLPVGGSNTSAHVDWANGSIDYSGAAPRAIEPPAEPAEILTPAPPARPRINGARIYGERPGRPFLFTIPATGEEPMTYAADNLPAGLSLNQHTGQISGVVSDAGTYEVKLTASNAKGSDTKPLRIVIGGQIALTPPMGWNSWNCFASAVTQEKVAAAGKAMVETGLIRHGWTYVNIDDSWQGLRSPAGDHPLHSNDKFPDLKALCDNLHRMGLKAGIYSTPWITSYAGFCGGSSHAADGAWSRAGQTKGHGQAWKFGQYTFATADAKQFAAWGVDYLKYDWYPISLPETKQMGDALLASGRDIVFSLSNSADLRIAPDLARLSNCWRTTGDITDTWQSVSSIGSRQDDWAPYGEPGHWNDPDMLVVGQVGWGPRLHPTRLTPNEQYSHITLWSLLSAPLLIGCDLTQLDPFTLNLLTNDEVLAVDQDALGRSARRVAQNDDGTEVWVKDLSDGAKAVGLFNRGEVPADVTVTWTALGLKDAHVVRDLWRQRDLGAFDSSYRTTVGRHGAVLLKVSAK